MTSIRSSIVQRLPNVLPSGLIDIENESYTFQYVDEDNTAARTVYTLDSGPFVSIHDVTATVDGSRQTIPPSAYETRQIQSDTGDDSIAFIDSGYYPDPDTEFDVDYRVVPVIERYVSAFDDDVETVDSELDRVIESHQIENATGQELDLIASYFGQIGERSGRSDNDYTVLLRSIVPSFAARGTKPGIKFAIASAVGADPEDITIIEDFEEVGYEIQIEETGLDFVTTAVTDIARLADPSGVELLSDPVIVLGDRELQTTSSGTTVVSDEPGIGNTDTYSIGGSWTLE